ncbi:MAG: M61 family metallopeptidase [Thermoanaerobaculia bacterium]
MAVEYSISWREPNEHLFDIAITFTAAEDSPRLLLPAWRPGRYLIQNYAANVREWSATTPIRKEEKSVWRVEARAGERITVRYRYYAGVLDAGSSFLDEEEAYFNGSNLFLMVESLRNQPARLTIGAPDAWLIETQLAKVGPKTFEARDYDHLIDSPTIASAGMAHHHFEEGGATVHLVFRGDDGIDTAQYVEPARAIVRSQVALFRELPVREYRFLYHVGDIWHGVEHEESCSIIVRRAEVAGAVRGDEGWDHMLAIASHEFFHLWNVKRILPSAFLPYDYSRETPTRLLWAMEGITSYYGELTLVRAGLWNEERYLRHLGKEIETLENAPARQHLSLSQASFDGWLQDPAYMHDKANSWISFYNKGEIVAALLDLAIRTRSERSLDDVMRFLWGEYGATMRGLEENAIEKAVAFVSGYDFSDFFHRYVDGVEPLPYGQLFAQAGITFESTPRQAGLGARFRTGDGGVVFESVVPGGGAMIAGILPGDELLAIDGVRVRSDKDVERLVRSPQRETKVELLTVRRGLIQRRAVEIRPDGSVDIRLRIEDGDSALRREWLRRDA